VDADKELKKIEVPYNQSVAVAVSDDGKTLATWGTHTDPENKGFTDPEKNFNRFVHFWDVASGKELAKFRTSGYAPWTVAFAPDGAAVAVANGNSTVDLVDPKSGASKQTLLGRTRMGRWVAFSPDGATVATSSEDGAVRRWKTADGTIQSTTEPPTENLYGARVRLLNNEKGIAWGRKGSALVTWEVPSGKPLAPTGGHTNAVRSVAVTADNKFVVTSADDGTSLKWELETGKLVGRSRSDRWLRLLTVRGVLPDLTRALTRDSGAFALYDVATGTQQYVIPIPPRAIRPPRSRRTARRWSSRHPATSSGKSPPASPCGTSPPGSGCANWICPSTDRSRRPSRPTASTSSPVVRSWPRRGRAITS